MVHGWSIAKDVNNGKFSNFVTLFILVKKANRGFFEGSVPIELWNKIYKKVQFFFWFFFFAS